MQQSTFPVQRHCTGTVESSFRFNGPSLRFQCSVTPVLGKRGSLQLGVFRLGLLEDWDVGIGIFPEREEILVCTLCLGLVS